MPETQRQARRADLAALVAELNQRFGEPDPALVEAFERAPALASQSDSRTP
jgi:hypothetical protein